MSDDDAHGSPPRTPQPHAPQPHTPPTLPIATRRRAFAHLAPHLRSRSGWIGLLLLAGLANAAAGLVGPWAIGRLVDELPAGGGADVVWTAALAVAVAGLVMATGTWVGAWALARVTMPAVGDLRTDVVTAALSLDAQRVEQTGTGDLVSRVADDSRKVSEGAAQVLPLVVESLLVVVVSAIGLTVVDWRLGLVGLTALPMYWLTLRWYLPRSEPIYRRERAAIGRRSGRLLGGLTGAQTLRAYRAEDIELARIDSASAEARDLSIGVFRFLTRAFSRNNRAEAVVLSLLLLAGFWLVWAGESSAGAVTTAALVFHRLFNPIGALVGLFDQVQSAGASLTRMVGVIDEAAGGRAARTDPAAEAPCPTALDSATSPTAGATATGGPEPEAAASGADREGRASLRLEDLWFSYEDDPESANHVLRGVDLTVAPGEVVAVVGTTGAGKSTLAKIAAGLAAPSRGTARLVTVRTDSSHRVSRLPDSSPLASGPPDSSPLDTGPPDSGPPDASLLASGPSAQDDGAGAGTGAGGGEGDSGAVSGGGRGADLTSVPEAELRSHIAMVAQEVHTFVGTIRDNVSLPVPDAPTQAVEHALRTVGAAWAFALPQGLDTVVGDGGERLSPLQEQMIALARLVLADPDIAILDEATAEAGSAGAHVLEAAASAALAGRGAIVVAHRLSQAQTADRILVMEEGIVVEEGTHDDLVAAGGRYARLWEAWSR